MTIPAEHHRWSKEEKRNACTQANAALKRGLIERRPCEICRSKKAQMHHDDYSKPLQVRWLCAKHHRRYHSSTGTAGKFKDVEAIRTKAMSMHAEGKTKVEIANSLGCSTEWLRQQGWLPILTHDERAAVNRKTARARPNSHAGWTDEQRRAYARQKSLEFEERKRRSGLAKVGRWLSRGKQ